MEETDAVSALAALAHHVRLQIFRALVVTGQEGLTPGAMQEGLGIAPATLSFHLKELMSAGLVTQQRDGRYLIYRAGFDQMNTLIAYLTENCCKGVPLRETAESGSCSC